MSLAIGIDIGGTKVAAGVVDEEGQVLAVARRRTPSRDPAHIADVVVEIVGQLRAEHEVCARSGSARPDSSTSSGRPCCSPPNLAWRDAPIRADIGRRLDIPVIVENDANAAAWGECRFGAGGGEPDVIVLTIGTGIGAGSSSTASCTAAGSAWPANPGTCGCARVGGCAAAATVAASSSTAAAPHWSGRPGRWPRSGRPTQPGCSTSRTAISPTSMVQVVTKAAQEGDPAAVDCFDEIGRWLGQGLADLAALLDPGRFVIGGGVAEAGDLLLAAGSRDLRRRS